GSGHADLPGSTDSRQSGARGIVASAGTCSAAARERWTAGGHQLSFARGPTGEAVLAQTCRAVWRRCARCPPADRDPRAAGTAAPSRGARDSPGRRRNRGQSALAQRPSARCRTDQRRILCVVKLNLLLLSALVLCALSLV